MSSGRIGDNGNRFPNLNWVCRKENEKVEDLPRARFFLRYDDATTFAKVNGLGVWNRMDKEWLVHPSTSYTGSNINVRTSPTDREMYEVWKSLAEDRR